MTASPDTAPTPRKVRPRLGAEARPVIIVFGALAAMVLLNLVLFPERMGVDYVMQQLRIAAFLGILSAGAMFVLLTGHIDLSVPWTLTAAAMVGAGVHAAFEGTPMAALAIPAALFTGLLAGLWNGIGVAYLRAPSMVWTMGLNALLLGLAVFYSGGYNPQTAASPLMREMAVARLPGGFPVATAIWIAFSVLAVVILYRTPLGAWIYALGRNERVVYLAGIRNRAVIVFVFVWAGLCSALAGVMLAGFSGQAYQAMGDTYLLPTIAAVVLGGTRVTGGSGRYSGTVGGVLVLVLLGSMLSLVQAPEAFRQIAYGLVILSMLLVAREGRST